jgi:hypothetical protein
MTDEEWLIDVVDRAAGGLNVWVSTHGVPGIFWIMVPPFKYIPVTADMVARRDLAEIEKHLVAAGATWAVGMAAAQASTQPVVLEEVWLQNALEEICQRHLVAPWTVTVTMSVTPHHLYAEVERGGAVHSNLVPLSMCTGTDTTALEAHLIRQGWSWVRRTPKMILGIPAAFNPANYTTINLRSQQQQWCEPFVAASTKPKPPGATCTKCREHNPYADHDPQFVCYSCKSNPYW